LSVAVGLLLVEPLASQRGGHPARSLPLLAAAAAEAGRPLVLVSADGVDPEVRASLEASGARVIAGPAMALSIGTLLLRSGWLLASAYRLLQPRLPRRQLPYQLELVGRCLTEAGSLRLGRAAFAPGIPVTAAVLTANVTLHACAAGLARVPHVRYLHDLSRDESRTIRSVEWLFARALRRTHFFCTTAAIEHGLRQRYPRVATTVQTYAMYDAGATLDEAERERARAALRLESAPRPVASLVGGWWQVKDVWTVVQALSQVTHPFTLLVAGYRMDYSLLKKMQVDHRGEMKVIDRQLTAAELRRVYAASDLTIVSRAAGGKESGVALDAVMHGVPLVISDHDDAMSRTLEGKAWARLFRQADPASLAQTLDAACTDPPPRPPVDATAELGMIDAARMLQRFDRSLNGVR